MYVILGATGNIGSVITNTLLAKGEKVRVRRGANKLQPFVDKVRYSLSGRNTGCRGAHEGAGRRAWRHSC